MKKLLVMMIALALLCGACAKTDAEPRENRGENRAEAQEMVRDEKVYSPEETTLCEAISGLNETLDTTTEEEPTAAPTGDGVTAVTADTYMGKEPSPEPTPSAETPPVTADSLCENSCPAVTQEPTESAETPMNTEETPIPTPSLVAVTETESNSTTIEEPEENEPLPVPTPTPEPQIDSTTVPEPTETPPEEPTTIEIETPTEEPTPEEIKVETPDAPPAPLPPAEEPTIEEPTPEEPATNEPVFINPAHGGANPFENPGDTEIDEHDSGEYVDDGGDRPGEGIHF